MTAKIGTLYKRFGYYKRGAWDYRVVHIKSGLVWQGTCTSDAMAAAYCQALDEFEFFDRVTLCETEPGGALGINNEQKSMLADLFNGIKSKFSNDQTKGEAYAADKQ